MPLQRPEYVRRVLIAVGIALLAFALFEGLQLVAGVGLLLFGGILLAVLLDGLAQSLSDRTPLSRRVALGVVLLGIVGLVAAMGWFLGPQIGEQMGRLAERFPETMAQAEAWLRERGWGAFLAERLPDSPSEALPDEAGGMGVVRTAFSTVFGALANVFILLFVGVYLALAPSLYIGGIVRLVPPARRDRAREVFAALGTALRHWLLGRAASMLVVGMLTAVGLLLFGIPLALTLGLIAALFSFVPYIGPLLAVIPAVAVAAGEGGASIITVLAVYGAVELAESYLITPLIQKRAVSMPPALLITAQVVLGVLAGAVGVAVATPLMVVLVVLVQMLYVQDVLGDEVEVMGSRES